MSAAGSAGAFDDRGHQCAKALDLEFDLVTGLEVAAQRFIAHLEQAARPHRPRPDQVAGVEQRVRGRAGRDVRQPVDRV